eukprot:95244-Pleurochrysis_carterae.AAC.1
MTMLCGGNDDDVLQSPAIIAALNVSGTVKTAASAAALRKEQRHALRAATAAALCKWRRRR